MGTVLGSGGHWEEREPGMITRRDFLKGSSLAMAGLAAAGLPGRFARADGAGHDGPPNVLLIMTDDQGYGDIGAHGHPHLMTPVMDGLREESVRLEQFHAIDPTCSPTRAGLMTGRYSSRVGVWHTVMGRYMLREDEVTIADVFHDAGYRTAIFGKWHLGDTYPYAPRFRGFEHSVVHWGGGVGQAPDYWGNNYFEDHYHKNGEWKPFQGYCTDVFFNEALRFIEQHRDEPFFVYLPTNAAHQTHSNVPQRYADRYGDVDAPDRLKRFWGMISNLDDNLGVLLDRLDRWGLADNTIVVFMTDDGTTMPAGAWGDDPPEDWAEQYNAGLRGTKGSHYDGGHRVPCFIRYPNGGIEGGRDITRLAANIDLMPTLLELCGLSAPEDVAFDGDSLVPLLKGEGEDWPDRTLCLHNQRVLDPIKGRNWTVMTDRWRLVDGDELYDIQADRGQQDNIIDEHPEVAERLREAYEQWWEDISERFDESTRLYVGSEHENPVALSSHDWLLEGTQNIPWHQNSVRNRMESSGPWALRAVREGRYAFVLRERPAVAEYPLEAEEARLKVGEHDITAEVEPGATEVRFEVELPEGDTTLQTWLIEDGEAVRGAYYVDVHYLDG